MKYVRMSFCLLYPFLVAVLILVLLACAIQAVKDGTTIWTVIFSAALVPINIKIKWHTVTVELPTHSDTVILGGSLEGVKIWMKELSANVFQPMVTIPDDKLSRMTEFTRIKNGRAKVISCEWVPS